MTEDGKLTPEENAAIHKNVMAQIADKDRRNDHHIKRSDIWNTMQTLRRIQRQLCEGYSFDVEQLNVLVSVMFGFINGVIDPKAQVKAADGVDVEEIIPMEAELVKKEDGDGQES